MLKLLSESKIILSFTVYDYKQGTNFYYIKVTANLINRTKLHIRKYHSKDDYNYSFHWQKEDGGLIVRWDNSPHHKELATYPHHKHVDNMILDSKEITLKEVLKYINKHLDK